MADRRRRRVQRDAGPAAEPLDGLEGATEVGQDLGVDGEDTGARLGKRVEEPVRVGDHQVHVERQLA